MARPYTGKNTVGESRVTQKNGVIYVYERTSKYDRETKMTITTGRRLKGKILPGTTEIVPTRPRKKRSVNKDGENSVLHDILKYPPNDIKFDPPEGGVERYFYTDEKVEDHGFRCSSQRRFKNHGHNRMPSSCAATCS